MGLDLGEQSCYVLVVKVPTSKEAEMNDPRTCRNCEGGGGVCYECGRGIPGWGETQALPWPDQQKLACVHLQAPLGEDEDVAGNIADTLRAAGLEPVSVVILPKDAAPMLEP